MGTIIAMLCTFHRARHLLNEPSALLNESSSLLIAFVYPSLTNVSAKVLLFNPFLEALKTEILDVTG